MATSHTTENERAMYYYYDFTVSEFMEDFRDMTKDVIENNINSLEEILKDKFPAQQETIETQISDLRSLFLERAEVPLKQIEATSREIFALPENIKLPTDVDIELVESEEVEKLEQEVSELMKKYKEEVCYKSYLEKQKKRYEQIQPLYEKVAEILNFHEKNKAKPEEKSVRELYEAMKIMEEVYKKKFTGIEGDCT
ncbi:uncharacterized protein LOC123008857 [Tribolium madens]|uniref:uncharacterized protein LOC123008857 n=1 Tax=Tribolium madens TaxID=41895 RepID=UPI001CF72F00|nr:uncharacterized protein LOC123008857 [Tribolium madens]